MRLEVFAPRVPDQRTEAQIETLMGATSPGNQAVMDQLAAAKAEQAAKDAVVADRLGTLSSKAAALQAVADQMAPALAAAEGEHQHLQQQLDHDHTRLDTLQAGQAEQDNTLATLRADLTTTAQHTAAAQQAATAAQNAAVLATDKAATAHTTATQAQATADTAAATAGQAKTAADAANSTATAASTTAGNAQATASQALTQAGTAKQTADTAAATATSATATATTAKTTADTAATTANAAKTKADQTATDLAALTTRVTVLEARKMWQEFGQATLGLTLIALGGTVDLPVTWTGPMPNTTYDIRVVSLPDALLGKLTLLSVSAKTATGCTVRLRASVALTLTGSVTLSATCLA